MDTESEDTSMTITKVYPGSPAEQAGFRTGDKLVSINGISATEKNEEKLQDAWKKSKIGDQVTYVVSRDAQDMTLKATLAQIPQDVLADLIDQHMKADHQVAKT